MIHTCYYCGEYRVPSGQCIERCIRCGLDSLEVQAIETVRQYGFEEAMRRQEARLGELR